jgi:hypothetical protein
MRRTTIQNKEQNKLLHKEGGREREMTQSLKLCNPWVKWLIIHTFKVPIPQGLFFPLEEHLEKQGAFKGSFLCLEC